MSGGVDADERELVEHAFVIPVKIFAGSSYENQCGILWYGGIRSHGVESSLGGEDIRIRVIAAGIQVMAGNKAEVEKGAGKRGLHAEDGPGFEMVPRADERDMRCMSGGNEQIRPWNVAA